MCHVLLQRPSEVTPYISQLCDPCTNSKVAPNIPAELLYDKIDNGLKLSNSWSGYHIILNPDYRSQVGGEKGERRGRGGACR